ncbi:MAG: CbtA family protein [Marmoricola sp.]
MTARTFLINGLIAGLLAGFAAFLVAHTIGEPPVNAAIAVEQSHEHGHHHEEGGTVVSRENQSTWGLLTGTLAIGTALGGLVALAAAGVVGRIGRLRPSQSTALVALVGFVAVALVPFLKYPASPPAVGDPGTIGERTGLFFGFLAVSLVAAIACTVLASRLLPGLGAYRTVGIGVGTYLLVVVAAAQLMPTVNEVGAFPAQTLWTFRRASVTTLAAMWGTIGFVLVGLVGRAHQQAAVETARRELAASL